MPSRISTLEKEISEHHFHTILLQAQHFSGECLLLQRPNSHRHSQGKPPAMFFPWQVQTGSTAVEHWSLTTACRHLHSPNNYFKQASAFLICHLPTSSPQYELLTLPCTSDDFKHCINLSTNHLYATDLLELYVYNLTFQSEFYIPQLDNYLFLQVTKEQSRGSYSKHRSGSRLLLTQKDTHFEKASSKSSSLEAAFPLLFTAHHRVPQNVQSVMISPGALIPNNCILRITAKPLTGSRNLCLMRK